MGIGGDNPQKVFALASNEWCWSVHWSPDGQRLAYIRRQRTPEKYVIHIETCDLKGAKRTVAIPDSGLWVDDFCWLKDGRIVYVQRETADSTDDNLWQAGLDVRTGMPTGKPKRISRWAGSTLEGLNASADGKRLTLSKATFQTQVYLGELTEGGTHMSPPRRLTHDEAID